MAEAWLYPLALLLDLLLGDPVSRLHPVALIGSLIACLEKHLLVPANSAGVKKGQGLLLVLIVLVTTYTVIWCAVRMLEIWLPQPAALIMQALLLSFTISPRSLTGAGRDIRVCWRAAI